MRVETRVPCPVCPGLKMEKLRIPPATAASANTAAAIAVEPAATPARPEGLVLDHCRRCGGVWFGAGELQRLRREDAAALWRQVVRRAAGRTMSCHSCRSLLPRDAGACAVCGWEVELDCPECERPLRAAEQDGMQLDYCAHCRGVWFDHDELAGIWRMQVDAVIARRGSRSSGVAGEGVPGLLDVLLYDPFALYYGVHVAGNVGAAAVEGLASAAGSVEVVGEVAGAAGEAAAGLFETIVEIVAGILS